MLPPLLLDLQSSPGHWRGAAAPLTDTPGLGANGFVCGVNKPHGSHVIPWNRGVSLLLGSLPDENSWLFCSELSGPFGLVSTISISPPPAEGLGEIFIPELPSDSLTCGSAVFQPLTSHEKI